MKKNMPAFKSSVLSGEAQHPLYLYKGTDPLIPDPLIPDPLIPGSIMVQDKPHENCREDVINYY